MHAPTTGPLRILAVEDNADALQMLCELLDLLGHEVSGAADATGAMELMAARHFDVLLTDVNLKGVSGIALARQAKDVAPTLRVVFVSGYDNAMAAHVGFPTSWLIKPYDLDALVAAISQSDSA